MEYLDIYDEEGNLTGEKATREEVHKKGLLHKSVHVWIINSKKELLIQKRSSFVVSHPNEWFISVSGHVSAGTSDIVSAVREVEEELGLKISPEDLTLIGTVRHSGEKREGFINNEINPIYIVKKDLELGQIKTQAEEVSEVKFMSWKELKDAIDKKDPSFAQHKEGYKVLFKYLEDNYN